MVNNQMFCPIYNHKDWNTQITVYYFGIWSLLLQDWGQLTRKCQRKIYGVKRVKITIRQPHTLLPLINMNPIKFFRSNALYMFSRTLTQNPWDWTDARSSNILNYQTVTKFCSQPSENVYLSVTSSAFSIIIGQSQGLFVPLFPTPQKTHEHNAVNHLCSTLSKCTNLGSFNACHMKNVLHIFICHNQS